MFNLLTVIKHITAAIIKKSTKKMVDSTLMFTCSLLLSCLHPMMGNRVRAKDIPLVMPIDDAWSVDEQRV